MDKSRYYKIVNKLVKDSFPKLKKGKIYLVNMNLGKFSGATFWLLPNTRLIFVNPKTGKWDDKSLKGFLAHELCHLLELFNRL